MNVLTLKIHDRAVASDVFASVADGIIVTPDFVELPVGSPAWIEAHHRALRNPMYFEALAAWRRMSTTAGGRRGTGFRLLSKHLDRLHYLKRCEDLDADADKRMRARLPCAEKVIVSMGNKKRTTTRLVHGTLEDLSPDGALLVTAVPLSALEAEMTIEFAQTPGVAIRCAVVWRNAGKTGLKRQGSSSDEVSQWMSTVSRVTQLMAP
jgi:hypothetical protein